jgi:alpha-L-arabinofuranosidase
MEIGVTAESIIAGIEPDRWYDVRIEIRGNAVKGYLDGKLIQEVSDNRANVKSLCASAARDDKSGDIILKIVNASNAPVQTQIDLQGTANFTGSGNATILTSASPLDENTLEEPTRVSPKTEMVKVSGTTLKRSFPGNSLTIIRLATKTR